MNEKAEAGGAVGERPAQTKACDHGATTRTLFHSMILMDGERGVECAVCLEAFRIAAAYGSGGAVGEREELDRETTETMLRVLHHAAAEHIRVWHGSIPTKDRAIETTPLRLLINAIDLAGEHLGEARINHDKARQQRKRDEYARLSVNEGGPTDD